MVMSFVLPQGGGVPPRLEDTRSRQATKTHGRDQERSEVHCPHPKPAMSIPPEDQRIGKGQAADGAQIAYPGEPYPGRNAAAMRQQEHGPE